MAAVMAFVLRSRSGDKVVECLHLGSHGFHLGVDYADCLFMDRLGGGLNRGVMLIDGLPIILHLALQGIPGFQDLASKQVFLLSPDFHTSVMLLIRCVKHRSCRCDILLYGIDARLPSRILRLAGLAHKSRYLRK